MLSRRGFLGTLSTGLLAGPLLAEAQPTGKAWRIGYLTSRDRAAAAQTLQPFIEGLRQLGYVEGKNLRIEVWAAKNQPEQLPALAEQLAQTRPDVMVVGNAGHASIAQKATRTLPIVTLAAGELASSGIVGSLTKPGGNVTGMQLYSPELMGKPFWELYRQATDDAAAKLGIRTHYVGFDEPNQLSAVFGEMMKERADGLLVWANPEIAVVFDRIQELTMHHWLPAMHEFGTYVRRGGLMAYGPKVEDVVRQAAMYVDRISRERIRAIFRLGSPRHSSCSSTSRPPRRSA